MPFIQFRDPPNMLDRQDPDHPDQPPPASCASIQVEVLDPHALLVDHQLSQLAELASSALAALPNTGHIRACIVDDERMSIAHAKFSNIEGTTDVLTFDLAPASTDYDQKILDTDLTICYDQARRQAATHNHTIEREILLYIIHGTLHCLGYDDHDEENYQRMHTKEDQLLARIGIDATFFTQEGFSQEERSQNNPTGENQS